MLPRHPYLLITIAILFLSPARAVAVPGASANLALGRIPSFLLEPLPSGLSSIPLPVGLLRLAGPVSETLSFISGEATEPEVDLGRALSVIEFPSILLFSPPSSPSEIRVGLGNGSVTLESGGGDIDIGRILSQLRSEPVRIALRTSFLIPVWTKTVGPVRLDAGYWLGAEALELVAAPELVALLEGGDAIPGTAYWMNTTSKADLSVGIRATFGVPVNTRIGVVLPSVSLRLPVSIFHAETSAGIEAVFGSDSVPEATTSWSALYWYPGEGIGLGLSADLGLLLRRNRVTFGLGARNIASAWFARGQSLSSEQNGPGPAALNEFRFRPVPLVGAHVRFPGFSSLQSIGAMVMFNGLISGSLVYIVEASNLSLLVGAGYDRGLTLGVGVGINFARVYIEPSLEIRTHMLTGGPTAGIGVQLARLTPRGDRR